MDAIQIKKLLPLLMTSLAWDLNFRLTFKNMDGHMDLGSYPALKFEPIIILIKNILCGIIFLMMYFLSKKMNSSGKEPPKLLTVTTENSKIIYQYTEGKTSFLGALIKYHNLYSKQSQILFCIKIVLLILAIYIFEEIYFIIANTHILDRLNVPMRNLSVLVTIFIFSSLLIKKQFKLYLHQLIPSIIVIGTSLFIILFNATSVTRFKKVFNINFLYYMIIYVLFGLEIVLIKYLTDIQFINSLLILGLKGIIGTIAFIVVNIFINGEKLFYFVDKFMVFEYDYMYEEFSITPKIFYIITTIIFQYLKIFIINEYSESHFLAVAMISDVFFFPLYFIEKFGVQKFPITTSSTFYLNIIFGVLNALLLLIFNEVIEVKFCGIEKNLNKNIEKRENKEMDYQNYNYKDDDSDIDLDSSLSGRNSREEMI